jgi:hypothetical protein
MLLALLRCCSTIGFVLQVKAAIAEIGREVEG